MFHRMEGPDTATAYSESVPDGGKHTQVPISSFAGMETDKATPESYVHAESSVHGGKSTAPRERSLFD